MNRMRYTVGEKPTAAVLEGEEMSSDEKIYRKAVMILDRFGETLYNRHREEKDPDRQAGLMTKFLENLDAISCMTHINVMSRRPAGNTKCAVPWRKYPLPDTEEEHPDGKKQVLVEIIEGLKVHALMIRSLKKSEIQCLEQVIEEYERRTGARTVEVGVEAGLRRPAAVGFSPTVYRMRLFQASIHERNTTYR